MESSQQGAPRTPPRDLTRARIPRLERSSLAFIALERDATWTWTWSRAHGFDFDRSVLVGQRRDEPLERFHVRVAQELARLRVRGGRVGLAALCVSEATTHAVVAPRFRLAGTLLSHLTEEPGRLILAAAVETRLMGGHLFALGDALCETARAHVSIDVRMGGAPAVEVSKLGPIWRSAVGR